MDGELGSAAALYAFHLEKEGEEDLYRYYAALPAEEVEAYVDLFIADDGTDPEDRLKCLLCLALFSGSCGKYLPDRLYRWLIPKCPECGRTMRFAAQFDFADMEDDGEGLVYFFSCDDCRVTAANYDQS